MHIKDLSDGIKKGDTSSTLDKDEKQDALNYVEAASEVQLAVIEGKPASVVKAALNQLQNIGEVDIPDPQIVVLSERKASENASQGELEMGVSPVPALWEHGPPPPRAGSGEDGHRHVCILRRF